MAAAPTPASPSPPASPSSLEATQTHKAILIGLWVGALFVLGSACLLAAYVADGRAEQGYVATATGLRIGRAAGPLSLVLTGVLLALGLRAYQRTIAASGRDGGPAPAGTRAATLPQQHAIWGRFRRGFLTMLAVFFLDTVAGLALFLGLDSPVATLFIFAGATFVLFCVALWRLVTTWPSQ